MYQKAIFLICAIHSCLGQSINSPPVDWIQTDETGAYRFGYATGDEGRHYHVSSATADNTVAGRFGYKDPATGGDLRTTYTAGRRGFRARGPHIARRMDLSQTRPPFSRPNDDGQYHPELDNVFDPNEDRGYDFSYRTPDHIKEEHANRVGDVQGRYSYRDDIGFRHNVEYIAGSKTGFVVTNPVPDTFAQARGGPLYFVGKKGGSKVRGFHAVQKNLNGAYRFLASGPDHKRSEISDAAGNRRGVYTYLDDKGIQHTVEYIAGPKIGYKVINNKKGVNYNPILPFFPDTPVHTSFPSSSSEGSSGNKPLGSLPTVPSAGSEGFPSSTSDGGSFSSSGGGSFPSSGGSSFPSKPSSGGGGGSSAPSSSETGKPSGGRPSGFEPSSRPPNLFKPSKEPSSIFEPSTSLPPISFENPDVFAPVFPGYPSTTPFPPAKPDSPDKWNYDFDYFLTDANKDWSIKGRPGSTVSTPSSTKVPAFGSFPDFPASPFPDPGFLIPDAFGEGLNTAESGNGVKPSFGSHGKDDCKNNTYTHNKDNKNKDGDGGGGDGDGERDRNRDGQKGKPEQGKPGKESGAHHYYKHDKALRYPSRGTVKFGGVKKEWHKTNDEEGYFAIPPGVAVRAHVQSLDIVPYSKRFVSPGEALDHHETDKKPREN